MNKKHIIIASVILISGFLLYNITKSQAITPKNVTVSLGEDFGIQFDTDLSLGFDWFLVAISDAENLELLDNIFIPHDEDPQKGVRLFTFRAAQVGTTEIAFSLRSNEDEDSSIQSDLYQVTIIG